MTDEEEPLEPFMTIEEVAAYLQVPVNSIYQWRANKAGPRVYKIGRHLRYRMSDIQKWLEESCMS